MSRKTIKKTKAGRPSSSSSTDDTRELLLKAAIPLFAKKGYAGTSVKDIADKAGVNVSLVSYHFKGKEGLYRTCLDTFGKNRLAATERLLQPAATREECRVRLEMFIDDMMVWFEEEPDLCAIVQREAEMGFQIARDVFENTFLKVFMTFYAFVKAGQTKGYLRSDIDTEIAARFFFIGLVHITQKDDLAKKVLGVSLREPAYQKKMKSQLGQIFFDGLAKDKVKK
jgi:AcrR family transcriptional regulator